MNEVPRPVGRPKAISLEQPPKAPKKGNPSWKPASLLDVFNKEDGYRYRWSNKAKDNLHKKELEGWETVSGLQADKATHVPSSSRINDGAKLTSIYEKHDCVLQRIPEETARERDQYYNNQSARQVAGLTAHIRKDLAKDGAEAHGEITISSRKGTQVIE